MRIAYSRFSGELFPLKGTYKTAAFSSTQFNLFCSVVLDFHYINRIFKKLN